MSLSDDDTLQANDSLKPTEIMERDEIDAALAEEAQASSEESSNSDSNSPSDDEISDQEGNEHDQDQDQDDTVPRTANEIVEVDIPKVPEGFEITDATKIEVAGKLFSIGKNQVVIQALSSGEYRILDEGAVFCTENREIIGPLYETFGPVDKPFYVVKFHDLPEGLETGMDIYYVVMNSNFVFTDQFKVKGSDASNIHDEEVALEDQEFSDDEAEAAAKAPKRRKRAKKSNRTTKQPTDIEQLQAMQNMQTQMQMQMRMQQMQMQIEMQNRIMQSQMSSWLGFPMAQGAQNQQGDVQGSPQGQQPPHDQTPQEGKSQERHQWP